MLHSNKTYDNSNIRDAQKVFNDGFAMFYIADERMIKERIGNKPISEESISLESFTKAEQNGRIIVRVIGVPVGGFVPEHGYVAVVNGEQYVVTHSQRKDYERPNWWKVYLERPTIEYESI